MTIRDHSISPRSGRLLCVLALALFATLAATSTATAAPALRVSAITPDYVTPGAPLQGVLNVQNVGSEDLSGILTITTTFPSAVVPQEWKTAPGQEQLPVFPQCQIAGQISECTVDVTGIPPGDDHRFKIFTQVNPGASGLSTGTIVVSGGGVTESSIEPFDVVAGPIGPYTIRSFEILGKDGAGPLSPRAASAPAGLTTLIRPLTEASTFFGSTNPVFSVTAPPEQLRDVVVHVPPGLVGNPLSTPLRCTAAQLVSQAELDNLKRAVPACPDESQIGLAHLNFGDIVPLYNMVPPPGSPAAIGFFYNSVAVTLLARVRPVDNGIDIVTEQADSSIPLPVIEVDLWGSPSDPSHDPLRGLCLHGGFGFNPKIGNCSLKNRSNLPFLRTPTSCTGPKLRWGIEIDTYQRPGAFVSKETETDGTEGCESVPFDPDLSLAPDTRAAHSPAGLEVELKLPQDTGPNGLAEADLKSAAVTLPEGVAINPPSADGLAACSDAQLRLGLEGPSRCPDAAKLGSVEVTTPLLEKPIGGSVFLRSQASNNPESGDLYRLAIELRSDERGLAIKLPGSLVANTNTGRLTATFDDLPQLPFESMRLQFKTGPRAPLTTPSTCGTYTTHATLDSWSGRTVQIDPSFTIDQGCRAPAFAPGFEAGVASSTAGAFAPFTLRVTRGDGQPNISRIDTTLPEGELAKLAGVPLCPEAAAPAGACPAASQIGSTTVGAGNGPSPLYIPQPGHAPTAVYLAGPYKGGPYSIVVKVPAQAGPFDLGTVSVRSALRVDPVTTRASVLSDPLPQIIGGVPVAYRDIRVNVDRPGFTLNPTSCEPKSVTGAIASTTGDVANVSDRFQLTDCAALGFKPKLALRLKGGTRRSQHPALRATLTMPKGGANIARASVALPHSEFLAQNHIRTVCTRVQFNAGGGGGEQCPAKSIYGKATAVSPLLDKPLSGPVYLRSSSNPLPDLVAALDGQIHVDLVGRIDSKNGGIRTTFAAVPDAPVSKFTLSMQGGRKGLLENSTNICAATNRVDARFDGQNGKVHDSSPALVAKCGKKKGKRK